jgi:ABC-type antimicrobial peptide transport system permease subunit
MLRELCRAGIEGMTDMSGSTAGRREIYKDLIASIFSLILAILIVAFVGKWLWNTTVAELFTFVRPVRSVWQIIGLMLFISLIN